MRPRDLDVIAVGLGPGSYTGLRIGLAAAKTLAYATGASILGLDSLEGLAWNAPPEYPRISVVVDAQRGDVYTADFSRTASGLPLVRTSPTRVEPLASWLDRIEPGTWIVGPGLAYPRIASALPNFAVAAEAELNRPDPARLIELADLLWNGGRRDDLWALEPRYLRRSAAEEQWEARAKLRSNPREVPSPQAAMMP
jgi:tRNA threonylcarbamoyladenosine biosynthesis protein TsaB